MRNKLNKITLAAGFGFALTFTFSCSSGESGTNSLGNTCPFNSSNSEQAGSSSSNGGSSNGPSPSSSSIKSVSSSSVQSSSSSILGTISTFTDSRDSKVYKSVKIGTQTWMAQNLDYNASGSKCYSNSDANCATYGRLYNWATAKTCPSGWHLPTLDEWGTLSSYVESDKECCDAKHLKAASGWSNGGNGLDTYGFSALPGGLGFSDGDFGSAGSYGYWWSATEGISNLAYYRSMDYYTEDAYWDYYVKSLLFSVRCLQD